MQNWFSVTMIDEKTFAISEWGHWEKVHSFLLLGKDEAILIDTGLGIGSMRDIVRSITSLPITVCTTHIHTDHIGSHAEFNRHFVHEAEQSWLEQGIPGRPLEAVKADLIRDCTKPLPKAFSIADFKLFTGPATRILQDRDIIEFGEREIEAIHTPGHSPGHLCFYEKTTGYLFSGDLLYVDAPIYAFYPSTNPKDLVASLLKISELKGVSKIFGSHNELGLSTEIFDEVRAAIHYMNQYGLVEFGTGIHEFKRLAFQF